MEKGKEIVGLFSFGEFSQLPSISHSFNSNDAIGHVSRMAANYTIHIDCLGSVFIWKSTWARSYAVTCTVRLSSNKIQM